MRTFPVMFFTTNELYAFPSLSSVSDDVKKLTRLVASAWIPNTDLKPIGPADCKDVSEKGKGKQLLAAYAVAAESHDLQYFKDLLAEHQLALDAENQELEAQAAAKTASKASKDSKKKKPQPKSSTDADGDVEMEDAGTEKPSKGSKKRRKSGVDTDGEAEKVGERVENGAKNTGSCLWYLYIARQNTQDDSQVEVDEPQESREWEEGGETQGQCQEGRQGCCCGACCSRRGRS